MAKVMRIGLTLVAYIEGKMYKKEFPAEELLDVYEEVANATDKELLELFRSEDSPAYKEAMKEFLIAKEEAEEMEDITDFIKEVRDNGHDLFSVKGHSLYLKGINISMPEMLIREILSADAEYLKGLINFWSLCAMNPDPRARYDLFEFLKEGKFSITQSGYFVAYRNVQVRKEDNKKLMDFITSSYLRVKGKMKKDPANYYITEYQGEYSLTQDVFSEIIIGNLKEWYVNLDEVNETEFTDAHTRTMSIKIGRAVQLDRKKCDADPNADCSRGLHVGNRAFLSRGDFGSDGLIVLVNPKNVVAVPHYNQNKMRVCEYLPIAIAGYDENRKLIEVEFSNFEHDLAQNTLEELDYMSTLNGEDLEEYKLNQFIAPEFDFESLDTMYNALSLSLTDANKIIKIRML
jgi:hypothetical protein